jgi:hypothetical protein
MATYVGLTPKRVEEKKPVKNAKTGEKGKYTKVVKNEK